MSCKVTITRDHEGRRLDRTIRSIWPALPLSAIMRGLRRGDVRLDAVRVRDGGTRVSAGQELFVPWEDPAEETHRVRARGTVPVIWRGENALVIDKPANLLVQPDVKDGDSVVSRVWAMFGAGGLGFSPAAVHRLDRNTTGVLIVALSGEGLRGLELLFKERRVDKRYLAVVAGETPPEGIVDAPLAKDETGNIVRVEGDGKTARTRYRRLAAGEGLSLVSIELLTGRTHQARVHMAHIGHPILGDRKYGDIGANRLWRAEARRPLLHARELIFPKDLSGPLSELAGKTFRADLPADMRAIIAKQGWPENAR
ncbi:MAG: RluA family pseudouridine synthase [Synergistaceae bacterium]|jgi:23S rRNA pseudouridine955/2504/2580 synthase|nr:RluA family pseudouridine synthase [Synergistaceae bacterium]